MTFTLTVAEDLDCSGLPASDETICIYDDLIFSFHHEKAQLRAPDEADNQGCKAGQKKIHYK